MYKEFNLKKAVFGVLGILLVSSVFVGCKTMSQSIPPAYVPLEEAEYEILGVTSAEAKGTRVLFFGIAGRDSGTIDSTASSLWAMPSVLSRVKANALYKALIQMPEADKLIAPQYKVEVFDAIIFATYKVTVTARGIKLKEGNVEKIAD